MASVVPGSRLGPYEIVSLIGSGGMGEVYKARDTRLARDVAIKVLPAGFSSDADRLQRFEQEARAAAALNHPNILAVYDVGTHEAAPYIVSELLEGGTLRERTRSGAIPVRKAIDYAVQIARGLAAAHEKGIVHRDLKPENVFVTTDGRVKILDFGLAKLTEREPVHATASMVPTVPPETLPGIVLGTIGYMSPEQVRGLAADHRSDIFAFGAIVYEMLSGQRAFRGDTTADTMTAILKEDPPDLPAAERHIPPALERIVDRCVEKSPAARFQSAGDLAFALDALSAHSGTAEAVTSAIGRGRSRDRLAWTLAGTFAVAFIAAVVVAALVYFGRPQLDSRTTRFVVMPPEGLALEFGVTGMTGGVAAPLSVSPDGRRVVFVARNREGVDRLWIRPLNALTAQELAGTDGASSPFWSPDSRFLGFFAGSKLRKIDVSGGPPITICDTPDNRGGAWSRDNVIVFSPALTGAGLRKVTASGGVPSPATELEKGDSGHIRPVFLPDGRHFIYTVTNGGMYIASLDASGRTLLFQRPGSSTAMYTQEHLLFMRETTLMAQPFDLRRLALTGEPFPVAEQIQLLGTTALVGVFGASGNGVLVYQTGTAGSNPQLTWFDRTGKPLGTVGDRAGYADLELSPDRKWATVSVADLAQRTRDIWRVDLTRGLRTRFTFDPTDELATIWSPDGRRIVFNSRRRGHLDLYQKAADGSGNEELLFADDIDKFPHSWSPDGRFILYDTQGGTTGADLMILPLSGDRKPLPFRQTRFTEISGVFSPDGRWIAYVSNESGVSQVYVAPFPGPGSQWQVSTGGGSFPRWRRDGKEIFYGGPDGRLMAAPVSSQGSAFQVGAVTRLFNIGPPPGARYPYDVSADGQRFLVNSVIDTQSTPSAFTVVVNWLAERTSR